jgi:hypothetical protein
MANAAYSLAARDGIAIHQEHADMCVEARLDAARAILGISPSSVADSAVDMVHTFGGRLSKPGASLAGTGPMNRLTEVASAGVTASLPSVRRPRSNSAGLDALAFLATREQEANEALSAENATQFNGRVVAPTLDQNIKMAPKVISSKPRLASAVSSSSSDDDSETMPPPPPRTMKTRRRSVSNPEGMGKWAPIDSMRRFHLVLPASILEEELAEATAAMRAKEETTGVSEKGEASAVDLLASRCETDGAADTDREKDDGDDNVSHDELLRRARSRLLEDLSEGNLNGDKGVLTLPHSLSKYKEVRAGPFAFFPVARMFRLRCIVCWVYIGQLCCWHTRCIIGMGESESTPRRNEQPSLLVFKGNGLAESGTKKSDTIVERIWLTDDCGLKADLSSERRDRSNQLIQMGTPNFFNLIQRFLRSLKDLK